MAKAKGFLNKVAHEPIFHKTSIGRHPSLTKMNKSNVFLNHSKDYKFRN